MNKINHFLNLLPFKALSLMGLGITLLLASSCKKLPTTTPYEKELLSSNELKYLSSKIRVNYQSDGYRLNAKLKLRTRKDSLIWASITGPVGVEGARVKIDLDSIFIIDRINKEYIASNHDTLTQLLKFEVDYFTLQALILGEMPFPKTDQDEVSQAGRFTKIVQERNGTRIENYLNTRNKKVERIFMENKSNKNAMEINNESFKRFRGNFFPSKNRVEISYINPKTKAMEKATITVTHSKQQLNEEILTFPFSIPSRYIKSETSKR